MYNTDIINYNYYDFIVPALISLNVITVVIILSIVTGIVCCLIVRKYKRTSKSTITPIIAAMQS